MKNISLLLLILVAGISANIHSVQAQVPNVKICVISDPHVFDSTLLVSNGLAIQTYLAYDRKLLLESSAILHSVLDSIIDLQPDILLISGDLTKDGELVSHQHMASKLQEVENHGIEVFVCPGNHDINNPHSFYFSGDSVYAAPFVTPADFKTIYADFGYNEAIATDTASLSFVVEPIPGFRIISMDVCDYENNLANHTPETGGRFRPSTLQWVLDRLEEAKLSRQVVFGMMHHGLVEHYSGQKTLFSDYVIDNWDTVSTLLANAGLEIVFTGHYHSQDIVLKQTTEGRFVYDIQTGSTVTYPCPYRIVELTADTNLVIHGKRIEHINYNTDTLTFQQYAYDYLAEGLPSLVLYMLMSPPYYVDSATAHTIEPAITESFIAHYEGNEGTPSPYTSYIINMLKLDSLYSFIGYTLESIWNDAQPDDWTLTIDLTSVPTGVEAVYQPFDFKIYPNPANGLYILFNPSNCLKNYRYQVFDINGKLIVENHLQNQPFNTIDIRHFPDGMYMLKLYSHNAIATHKLIKQS